MSKPPKKSTLVAVITACSGFVWAVAALIKAAHEAGLLDLIA